MSPLLRLRLVLLLVSAAVFAAIALLADRALQAAEQERELRERLVAERVYDELEEALTRLVEAEEGRPFFHWRAAYLGEGGRLAPSPLVSGPESAWIRGYFQIDPDGALSTPHEDPSTQARLADWTEGLTGWGDQSPPLPDRVVEVMVPVRPRPAPEPAEVAGEAVAGEAAAGEAVAAVPEPQPPAEPAIPQVLSLADADQALNNGYSSRMGRKGQRIQSYSAQVDNFVSGPPQARGYGEPPVLQLPEPAPAPLPAQPPAQAPPVQAPTAQPTAQAPAPSEPSWRKLKVTVPAEPTEVDVAISPFHASARGSDLLLHRTVRIGGRTWVQGLVLDGPALQQALVERVVVEAGLGEHVHLAWGDEPPVAGGFAHRFAAPFDSWTASLSLSGLGAQGPSPWGWIAALAGLTAAVTASGLLLAYRAARAGYAAAEQRADFVSAVTHELRAPLTSIRLYSEMLEADVVVEPAQRRSYLATIRGEAERLTRLVDDVLAFARIERGRPAAHLPDTALAEAIERVLALHRPQLAEAGLEVRLDLGDAAQVRVPGDAVAQVLGNLLDNARKFSAGAATPVICVTARGRLTLSVRDHGPGVPPRQLQRIFQPFVRGERELQRRTRGTGIGLALVAGLVRDLGGTVGAENAAGGGLEVTVSWPA